MNLYILFLYNNIFLQSFKTIILPFFMHNWNRYSYILSLLATHNFLFCWCFLAQKVGNSPQLCCGFRNFCDRHGDRKITDPPVYNTLFLKTIPNLCFVRSETGRNMVKRCIGTPRRAKTGPSDVFRAKGPLYREGLSQPPEVRLKKVRCLWCFLTTMW